MWKLGMLQRLVIYLKIRTILFVLLICISMMIWNTFLFMSFSERQSRLESKINIMETTILDNERFYMGVVENIFYHLFPEIEASAFLTQRKLDYTDKLYRIKWLCGMMGIKLHEKDLEKLVDRTRAVNIVKVAETK